MGNDDSNLHVFAAKAENASFHGFTTEAPRSLVKSRA